MGGFGLGLVDPICLAAPPQAVRAPTAPRSRCGPRGLGRGCPQVGTQGQALSGAALSRRRWCTDLPRGACLLISISVEHDKLPVEGGVKAIVLTSQYLIEPSAMGRSKVTHICRADLR